MLKHASLILGWWPHDFGIALGGLVLIGDQRPLPFQTTDGPLFWGGHSISKDAGYLLAFPFRSLSLPFTHATSWEGN